MSLTNDSIAWPEPSELVHVTIDGQRYGRTPDGLFPGVTGVIKKTLGLGSENLIGWAAATEREACLAAAEAAIDSLRHHPTGAELREAIEAGLGRERASKRKMEQAADIGTQLHAQVAWFLNRQMGREAGDPPTLSEPAMAAYVQWVSWWQTAGITPVRVEQPLWSKQLGSSGTADLIGLRDERLGIWDFKSSAGIYLEHHLQVAGYVEMTRNWAPVEFGEIVRLPKKAGELFNPEKDVEEMGDHRYSGRKLTHEELVEAFKATLTVWRLLVKKQEAM